MNKTNAETRAFFEEFSKTFNDLDYSKVIICPSFTSLVTASEYCSKLGITLGAQNMHDAGSGAHTGEVSAGQLKDLGVKTVLIGHSERRATGEENDFINRKVKSAITSGLTPIFCIGEPLSVREEGATENLLTWQITTGLKDIKDAKNNLIVAYEPVWAIGTGKVATLDQIRETHAFIKKTLNSHLGHDVPLLYGGSVTDINAQEILSIPNVDGVLVGGAALDPQKFAKICV